MRSSGVGRVAVVALITASLLLGFLASLQVLRLPFLAKESFGQDGEPTMSIKASIPLEFRARVEAYKNGDLVFAKDGDPWTLNFAKMIKLVFFTYDRTDWPDVRPTVVRQPNRLTTITSAITNLRNDVATTYVPVIGIGNGTAEPSINDVSLQSTIALFDVLDYRNVTLQDVGGFFWLTITGSFTGLEATVSEVGLFVRVNEGGTSPLAPDQAFLLLLARDIVSPPIALAAGDVLTVRYAIRIPKDVLTRYGFCDLIQFVFGLGDWNLRQVYSCYREYTFFSLVINATGVCTSGFGSSCVTAVFVTSSITYTNRFGFRGIASGYTIAMKSPMTTITTNATHLIIRAAIRVEVPSDSTPTLHGLVLYRGGLRPSSNYDTIVSGLTYTAFTTLLVDVGRADISRLYTVPSWTVMFIPFDPPLTVPAGAKVQVTLELAIPIS